LRSRFISGSMLLALSAGIAVAQITSDVLGAHDMSPATGAPITGSLGSPCMYCHAPHSGLSGAAGVEPTPLWSQKLSSVQSYQVYTSTTMVNKTTSSPPLSSDSTLCLSCHDGTVAVGTLTPYGQVSMTGSLSGTLADLGTNLQSTHPFSFVTPLQASPDLWPSLSANPPSTQDTTGAVRLINGNVECGTCHNPHVQNIDPSSDFLVINNSESALCLACHSAVPSGTGTGMTAVQARMRVATQPGMGTPAASTSNSAKTKRNPLEQWKDSIHANASNRVGGQTSAVAYAQVANPGSKLVSLGGYTTVRQNGCLSCHVTHNAAPNSLLRASDEQTCMNCHSGGPNVSPPAPNIFVEMTAPKIVHSFGTASGNSHSPHESELLNHNRHATCVDCHNPHATNKVALDFPAPPIIRASQNDVAGISASDGVSVLFPAINQFENCLRCHGTSTGKVDNPTVFGYLPNRIVSAADPLNVIPQLSLTSTSSHPVMHARSSLFPQPSLLVNMLDLNGITPNRNMGTRILCTDCHNSDDNREFGGAGPNGPHGSRYAHILERRYDMSQASAPGQFVINLNRSPNLSATGNYALCAKCHDLSNIMRNASFSQHARHINDGFSCSVCHTAHGMGGQAATISGERLVNFDLNVVAPNGTTPISYSRATNSCSLACHGHAHNLPGTPATGRIRAK
jgi:predicted CXXCH cytochrome family protein